MLQDDLADGAGPSGDQQAEAPQPNALEEEAAAATRPDEADCKPHILLFICGMQTYVTSLLVVSLKIHSVTIVVYVHKLTAYNVLCALIAKRMFKHCLHMLLLE